MDTIEKLKTLRQWVDPEELVTVDFLDEKGLNGVITSCTDDHVELYVDTRFPHMKQHLTVPIEKVEIGEDRTHYTRDPERPLHYGRLRLFVLQNRPQWM